MMQLMHKAERLPDHTDLALGMAVETRSCKSCEWWCVVDRVVTVRVVGWRLPRAPACARGAGTRTHRQGAQRDTRSTSERPPGTASNTETVRHEQNDPLQTGDLDQSLAV